MADADEFKEEEAQEIVDVIIEKILGEEKTINFDKLQEWIDLIIREVLEELVKLKKSFKYIVTCMIDQRNGAGLVSHSSCWLNNETDSIKTLRWKNDAMNCVVSIYVFATI